jgi:hypothetical protein
MDCELLYDLELGFRKIRWGDPALAFDEEKELFRFTDGRFAFSREHADWALLRKRGRARGFCRTDGSRLCERSRRSSAIAPRSVHRAIA